METERASLRLKTTKIKALHHRSNHTNNKHNTSTNTSLATNFTEQTQTDTQTHTQTDRRQIAPLQSNLKFILAVHHLREGWFCARVHMRVLWTAVGAGESKMAWSLIEYGFCGRTSRYPPMWSLSSMTTGSMYVLLSFDMLATS